MYDGNNVKARAQSTGYLQQKLFSVDTTSTKSIAKTLWN